MSESSLAFTGSNTGSMMLLALMAMMLGSLLVLISGRQTSRLRRAAASKER